MSSPITLSIIAAVTLVSLKILDLAIKANLPSVIVITFLVSIGFLYLALLYSALEARKRWN
jgi:hypothetical protein